MATVTASSTTSAQVLAANTGARRQVILSNTDANLCYVLLGEGTASSTNFSFALPQNGNAFFDYDGAIQAVWAADGSGHLAADSFKKN